MEGHTAPIEGAMALGNGSILSWSGDDSLRLWDGKDGSPVAVLEGHSGQVARPVEALGRQLLPGGPGRPAAQEVEVPDEDQQGAALEGPGQGLTEGDAHILIGVVVIDVGIAGGLDVQIEKAMAADLVEHVIQERHPGAGLAPAGAVEVEGEDRKSTRLNSSHRT